MNVKDSRYEFRFDEKPPFFLLNWAKAAIERGIIFYFERIIPPSTKVLTN
jgi:hypothetical protein